MSKAELGTIAEEIRILIMRLAKMGRQDILEHLETHGAGIGAVDYGVLRILLSSSYTISEMSKIMLLEPATLVPVIDELEHAGYVRRGRDPQDRRRNPIELTESGIALIHSIPAAIGGGMFYDALVEMTPAQVNALRQLLHLMANKVMDDPQFSQRLAEHVCRHKGADSVTRDASRAKQK